MLRAILVAALAVSGCAAPSWTLRDAPSDGPGSNKREITIRPVTEGAYLVTQWSPWPANALLVEVGAEHLVLVDALYSPKAMEELLAWTRLKYRERSMIAFNTHYHADRTGGNPALLAAKVPVYAPAETVALMKKRGKAVIAGVANAIPDEEVKARFLETPVVPADGTFSLAAGMSLTLGGEEVKVFHPGAGHTSDNVAVWFPAKKVLYAGCLAVASAKLGNAADADLASWAKALDALEKLPAEFVVTGHHSSVARENLAKTREALAARSSAD